MRFFGSDVSKGFMYRWSSLFQIFIENPGKFDLGSGREGSGGRELVRELMIYFSHFLYFFERCGAPLGALTFTLFFLF